MRIGALVAVTTKGEYKTLNQGSDLDGMKQELKALKTIEGDGKYQAAYLFINPVKKMKFKPVEKTEVKATPKKK